MTQTVQFDLNRFYLRPEGKVRSVSPKTSRGKSLSRSKTLEERHDRAAELSFFISFPYVVKEGKQEVFPEGI